MKSHDDRSLRWLARRLSRVGPGELSHRLRTELWWARQGPQSPAPPTEQHGAHWLSAPPVDPAAYVARAERVLHGELPSFGGTWESREQPLQWNRDPRSARVMPLSRGDRVPLRRPDQHGDVRRIWEAMRQHHLPWLAQAWALTGEDRFLDGLTSHVGSFLAQCPYPQGAAWTSALEVSVRTASWAASWQLVRGALPQDVAARWEQAALRGLALVEANLSIGSSANNHLLGELGGLVVGCATWRPSQLERWLPLLRVQLLRQIAPDGSGAEGSLGYLAGVAGWGVTAGIAAGAQGARLGPPAWERLAAAGSFLRAASIGGSTPNLADDDTGQALQLGLQRHRPARMGVLLGRLLDDGEPANSSAADPDVAWLCSVWRPPSAPSPPVRGSYPDAGHLWLRAGGTTALLVARPPMEASLDAHAHADALSLLLWHDGVAVLVDSGTGSYLAEPAWRAYFRGTSAHSTATVDDADSSAPSGAFQWQRLARTQVEEHSATTAAASHDGFARLPDPVAHRRSVTLSAGRVVIDDHFACAGPHTVALHWQLPPAWRVSLTPGGAVAESDSLTATVSASSPLRLARGQLDPRLGWHSETFGDWEPSPTLVQRVSIDGSTTVRTVIELSGNAGRACPD